MNTTTISAKVTQDIAAKAAKTEGKSTNRPSEDTVAMLEDAISLVKGMEFYGKVTKSFTNNRNPTDALNGKFCTIPVKMAFRDKDTKQKVESLFRSKCKIQCTTPYPLNLRKAIEGVLDAQKALHPEQFIQVRVDAEAGTLTLSRKHGGKKEGKWINNYETIQLSCADMDLGRTSQVEVMESESQQAL